MPLHVFMLTSMVRKWSDSENVMVATPQHVDVQLEWLFCWMVDPGQREMVPETFAGNLGWNRQASLREPMAGFFEGSKVISEVPAQHRGISQGRFGCLIVSRAAHQSFWETTCIYTDGFNLKEMFMLFGGAPMSLYNCANAK